jgi:Big-like domain-containing protein
MSAASRRFALVQVFCYAARVVPGYSSPLSMTVPMKRIGVFLALGLAACSDPDPVFTPAQPLPADVEPLTPPQAPASDPPNETPVEPVVMPPVDMMPPTDIDNPEDVDEPDDMPPPEDTTPFIVSVSPENGARGVESDAALVITFSEPMDRVATESAYLSEDLPSDGVSFSWSSDSTVLTITPNDPLALATGTNPEDVTPLEFTYVISDLARDAEGDALLGRAFSFSTAREITQTFAAVQDRDLTGNFRGNGSYGSGDCARNNQTTVCVGDSATPPDFQFKGFLSFDLRSLPADMKRLSMAELSLQVTDTTGNAFNSLGDLVAEHVSFGIIDAAAFDAASLDSLGVIATAAVNGTLIDVDVLGTVQSDVAADRMTQFRLRFQDISDDDGNADIIVSDWTTQQIRVVFLMQ